MALPVVSVIEYYVKHQNNLVCVLEICKVLQLVFKMLVDLAGNYHPNLPTSQSCLLLL